MALRAFSVAPSSFLGQFFGIVAGERTLQAFLRPLYFRTLFFRTFLHPLDAGMEKPARMAEWMWISSG
jgi:hypothetical protein